MKLISYYAKVELFRVVSENSRRRTRPIDLRFLLSWCWNCQINSALRFLKETTSGGVLPLTDEVMSQLKQKHPNPQAAQLGSLLFGPMDNEFPDKLL